MFQLTDGEKNKVVANCDQFNEPRFSYQNPYASNLLFLIKPNYKWAEFDENIQKSPTYNV